VLLDAPATGHGLELLRLPKAIAELSPAGLLRRDADLAWQLLRDPAQTCICLVTLPEELPTNETLELAERIHTELGLPLGAVALNRTSTAVFSEAERTQLSPLGGLDPSGPGEAALRAAALCAIAERVQSESIARLSTLAAPLYQLPDVDSASPRALLETLTKAFTSRP
jgi:anion-transporting  ArsA/GET3 family ATPase